MAPPAKPPVLIIFDVDGTLVDAHALDNASFNDAFTEVTGIKMTESMWSSFEEVTSQSTIHQALGKGCSEDISSIKDRIKNSFFEKLRAGHSLDPTAIRAFGGAVDLVSALQASPDFRVAIATGCWKETGHFKLKTSGFDLTNIPFASASDCYSRADIISLAAQRAGMSVEHAVYVGDGLWDLRATRQLGIPFIGVGRKVEALRQAGAEHTLDALNADTLTHIVRQLW